MRLETGGQSEPRAGENRGRNSDAGAGNGGGSAGGNAPAGAADHPGSGAV